MNSTFKKNLIYLLSFIIFFFFTSCASTKIKKEKQFLQGIIYDYDSEPVSGAEIFLLKDNSKDPPKSIAYSDVTGHFSITSIKNNAEYTLISRKKGYEDTSIHFLLTNTSQIIYLRMYSYNQLLSIAEEKVSQKDFETAITYIKRAETADGSQLSSSYLLAIITYLQGNYNDALSYCQNLLNLGYNDSYIYLLMADIYENGFNDIEKTIIHLKEYLKRKYNPEVEKRLKILELITE